MNQETESILASAVDRLRAGGLVAFPTETVYGLGADALSEAAVRRVFELKGRPAHNPLIVHVADEEMSRRVSADWPAAAGMLARRFWPGPVTIIVPRAPIVPELVTAGGPTVAVRCPDHPLAMALLELFGGPIVGPSANRSGSVSPTRAEHVRAAFSEEEVMVLDGGPCRTGIESTVVSLAGAAPRILRQGVVGAAEIGAVLGVDVALALTHAADDRAPRESPGMLERHYAPRAPLVLFEADVWPEIADEAHGAVVLLTHERTRHVDPPHHLIRMPMDAPGYAAWLYAALHEADALAPARILVERPTGQGALWDAIRDRLARAATA